MLIMLFCSCLFVYLFVLARLYGDYTVMFDLSVVGSCWSYCRHVLSILRFESNSYRTVLFYMFVCLFVLLGLWCLGLIADCGILVVMLLACL